MPATQKARLVVWVGRDDASTIKRAAHLRRLDLSSYARMVLFAAARADLASTPATPASAPTTPASPGVSAPSAQSAPGAQSTPSTPSTPGAPAWRR